MSEGDRKLKFGILAIQSVWIVVRVDRNYGIWRIG